MKRDVTYGLCLNKECVDPKKGFTVENLSSVISGSGSINVNANDRIEAVISGSGSINYGGNASVVEKKITGSGRVRKI